MFPNKLTVTHKIAGGRPQPLLNPPKETDLKELKLQAHDITLMVKGLEKARREGDGWYIGHMHMWMRMVGCGQEVTASDMECMTSSLFDMQRKMPIKYEGNAPPPIPRSGIAKMLHLKPKERKEERVDAAARLFVAMRKLGIEVELTDKIRTFIEGVSSNHLKEDDNNPTIAEMKGFAKYLKMDPQVTAEDERLMGVYVDWARGMHFSFGFAVFREESCMKMLGISHEDRKKDAEIAKNMLERYRKHGDGKELGELMYLINEVVGLEETKLTQQDLPPIKKL